MTDRPVAHVQVVRFGAGRRHRRSRLTAVGSGPAVHLDEHARVAAIAQDRVEVGRAAGCDCAPLVTLAVDDHCDVVMAINVIHADDCPRSRQLGAVDN